MNIHLRKFSKLFVLRPHTDFGRRFFTPGKIMPWIQGKPFWNFIYLPQIWGKSFRHRKNMPQIRGKILPPGHKRASDSRQIIPISENLPSDSGHISTPVHKCASDSRHIIPTSEKRASDLRQISTPWAETCPRLRANNSDLGKSSPRFRADFCTPEAICLKFQTDHAVSRMPCSRFQTCRDSRGFSLLNMRLEEYYSEKAATAAVRAWGLPMSYMRP